MNKSELVVHVATKTGQPAKVVSAVLEAVFEGITETVAAGGTAVFAGFGTFSAAARRARPGRNPQTGATLQLAARKVPKFSPGTTFKAKVRNRAANSE